MSAINFYPIWNVLIFLILILLSILLGYLFRVDRNKYHRNFADFIDYFLDNKKVFIFLLISLVWVLFHYYSIINFFSGFIYFLEMFLFLIIIDIIVWRFLYNGE